MTISLPKDYGRLMTRQDAKTLQFGVYPQAPIGEAPGRLADATKPW
jgi:hypothetical protein